MEIVFLLISFFSSLFTSITGSLLLFSRLPLSLFTHHFSNRRHRGYPTATRSSNAAGGQQEQDEKGMVLYEGTVWHRRQLPVLHSFNYNVRYALLDLDRPPSALPRNHMSSGDARAAAGTQGPVFLLTIPTSVGYEQNPLSVYYCYDDDRRGKDESCDSEPVLRKCIAEVTNTPWGERVSFVFNPMSDMIAKPLHVSPFMDMLGNWKIRADPPGENLFIRIEVEHPNLGNYFVATLQAKKSCPSNFLKLNSALFFWLMPQKVALWIYWQALKLWWKGVPFVQHPRDSNCMYREEALMRDRKLSLCEPIGRNHGTENKAAAAEVADSTSKSRWCVWRDADWPWN